MSVYQKIRQEKVKIKQANNQKKAFSTSKQINPVKWKEKLEQ